ncbi:hypothetical protein [Actinoplanes sp. GCM10030250]|uniref:hypothetical protein n=1 Tax=Actinoplanes sp. GCM10030250 TaxID=3273376 RepID=UPI0036168ADF
MAWEWVGPAVTGTVGTVTISVTAWLAHKTLRIQHDRNLRSDRRSLYGRLLGALHEMKHSEIRMLSAEDLEEIEVQKITQSCRDAQTKAAALLAEVSIVAPLSVDQAATDYFEAIAKRDTGSQLAQLQVRLLQEMRKDIAAG